MATMRYLVKARVKTGREKALLKAIGSGAWDGDPRRGNEYLRNMREARIGTDDVCHWVKVCFCATPLEEERACWKGYFDLVRVQDAHARRHCRDWNGAEPWACCDCDCTERLQQRLQVVGKPFLEGLRLKAQ